MVTIPPFSKIPGNPLNWPVIAEFANRAFDWLIKFIGIIGQSRPVTKNSTAEDISELNRAFAEYRKSVEVQAAEVEAALCKDLESYAEDLVFLAQTDHPVFQKYRVRFQRFQRRADALPDRMRGVVMGKISRIISLDSPECSQVVHMLPGAEKDQAADKLLRSALQQGLQAAAVRANELSQELLEEYEDAVSEAIDQIAISSDAIAKEADCLAADSGGEDAELTRTKSETALQAIMMIESLLTEESNGLL